MIEIFVNKPKEKKTWRKSMAKISIYFQKLYILSIINIMMASKYDNCRMKNVSISKLHTSYNISLVSYFLCTCWVWCSVCFINIYLFWFSLILAQNKKRCKHWCLQRFSLFWFPNWRRVRENHSLFKSLYLSTFSEIRFQLLTEWLTLKMQVFDSFYYSKFTK